MSWTIAWLLTRMLLMRLALILVGLTVFVLMLDVVTYADAILETNNGDAAALARYALLRAPGIAAQFMVIAVLLATLLMLTEVSRHSELVAIWSTGISQFRILVILMPAAALIGIFNFWLADQAVPMATPGLYQMGVGEYSAKEIKVRDDDPIWLRSGKDILRATSSNANSTILKDVTIFRRDDEGVLIEQIMAGEAVLRDGRWRLKDAVIYYRDDQPPNRVTEMIYSASMRPAAAGKRSGNPQEMSISDLVLFIQNAGFGIRPSYVYTTWLYKRLSILLSAALMILIAVPLAHRFTRGGGLGILFAVGVAMGFAFFIFDGISLTMGELGFLPPWLAAWTPVLVFAGAAGSLAVRQESL